MGKVKIGAFLLLMFVAPHAFADSFKCGKHFVETGDSKASVLLRCGKPLFQEVVSGDEERKVEQLTYKGRGYRGFIRILTFEAGVLRRIAIGERVN